jgi:hypothetical protein
MLNLPKHMLVHDEDTFHEQYKDARAFLIAASLRDECFTLFCRKHKSDWDKKRLEELLECPACKERWFLNLIGEE